MSKNGLGKFILGLGIGAGLGILFAPKKGSETRAELRAKIDELVDKVQAIDFGEMKDNFLEKIEEIRRELMGLEKEENTKKEKYKASAIVRKTEELQKLTSKTDSEEIKALTEELNVKSKKVLEDVSNKSKSKKNDSKK